MDMMHKCLYQMLRHQKRSTYHTFIYHEITHLLKAQARNENKWQYTNQYPRPCENLEIKPSRISIVLS